MKRFIKILPLLSIVIISCKQNTCEDYLKKAKSEIRVEEKIELMNKAVEADSTNFEAIYERACENGDHAIDMKRIIAGKMHPENGDDRKLYTDCLRDFQHVFRLNPNHAPSYFKRGIVEHWMGDSIKACEDLNKASTLGYNCSEALKDFCK